MRQWLLFGLRLILGLTFTLGVLAKVAHPLAFAATVASYQYVHGPAIGWVVGLVVAAEAVLALAMFFGWRLQLAGWASVVVLTGFSGIVMHSRLHGQLADCGCFPGLFQPPVGPWFWLRNGLLIASSVLLARLTTPLRPDGNARTRAVTGGLD